MSANYSIFLNRLFISGFIAIGILPFIGINQIYAKSRATLEYPLARTYPAAKGKVDVDLVKFYEQELQVARKSLSKDLTPAKRQMELSLKMQKKNQEFLSELKEWGTNSSMTLVQAQNILNSIPKHPIIGNPGEKKYDPNHEIGYCFGRAAYVHLELLRQGVPAKSIGKIFVLGSLYREYRGWDFHLATIVKSSDGEWLVIDNLVEEVSLVPEWMKKISKWDRDSRNPSLRFYFTDPVKFLPLAGPYSKESLNNPIYNNYFIDLLKWFRESADKPST